MAQSENITTLSDYNSRRRVTVLNSGDGGGTFDPMEPRVKALEDKFLRMESKLDTIGTDLSYIKGKLEGMPTAIAFGELKGRVDSLPTLAKISAVVAIVGTLLGLFLKAPEIWALFHR